MARPTAPCCEIRFLVLHTYPDGIKAYGHERITTPSGRRGKPVKTLRLIPAEMAFALACRFQGRYGTTVSLI
jgi:hypothetical protein